MYAIIYGVTWSHHAGMVELADASDSKSEGSNTVSVRPRLPAPNLTELTDSPVLDSVFFYFFFRDIDKRYLLL